MIAVFIITEIIIIALSIRTIMTNIRNIGNRCGRYITILTSVRTREVIRIKLIACFYNSAAKITNNIYRTSIRIGKRLY